MGCLTSRYNPQTTRWELSLGCGSGVRLIPSCSAATIDTPNPSPTSMPPTLIDTIVLAIGQGKPAIVRGPNKTMAKRQACTTTYHSPRAPRHQTDFDFIAVYLRSKIYPFDDKPSLRGGIPAKMQSAPSNLAECTKGGVCQLLPLFSAPWLERP